jgi:CDP-4-dehydro-6-deoxyglucose reductase, E3
MSSFEIKTSEGEIFSSSEEMTILDCALSSNIIFDYSCKSGQCGACKTTLIKGKVIEIKPQLALKNKDGQDKFLTCCCVPASDILINALNLKALQGIEIKISPCKINTLNFLSDDILEVTLRVPPNSNFVFLEGQHIDIIGPKTEKRSYSIANSSNKKEIKLLIKRYDDGLFSDFWFNEANLNDLLRMEGPKGTFYLRDKDKSLVFLATGTGIAPIISILEELDENSSFLQDKKISLFWGNREEKDFIWDCNFKNLEIDFHKVLSRKINIWDGDFGYVQDVALRKIKNFNEINVFACGSSNMIESSFQSFTSAGLNPDDFFSDAFVQNYNNSRSVS